MRTVMLAMVLVGCGGDDGEGSAKDTDTTTTGATDGTSTTDPTTTTTDDPCAGATLDSWAVPSSKSGALWTVELTAADPADPFADVNTWTVKLTDAAGAPVDGATLVLTPFMSVHGHGTSPPTFVGVPVGGGEYTVGPFDLIMPGPWEFTFDLTVGADTDAVMFAFCVAG